MDIEKVDQVLQFALLVAASDEDYRRRKLGPIHLIKYAYLADLNHANFHQGETFTGAPWRFYKFGPWDEGVFQRLEPALDAIDATMESYPSHYDDDDYHRWSMSSGQGALESLIHNLERNLPTAVTSALKKMVRQFASDTTDLLHEVYKTLPMLRARPNEALSFAPEPTIEQRTIERPKLTARQEKKRKQRIAAAREKLKEIRNRPKKRKMVRVEPKYDENFSRIQNLLNEEPGQALPTATLQAEFDDSVWDLRKGEPSGE